MHRCPYCTSDLKKVSEDYAFVQLIKLPNGEKQRINVTAKNCPFERCESCGEIMFSGPADAAMTKAVNEEVIRLGLWPAPKEKTIYLSYGHKSGYKEIFDPAYETAEQALHDLYSYAQSPADKFSTCSLLVVNGFERLFEARLIFDLKLIVGEKTYDFVFDNRGRSGILQPCDIFDVSFNLALMHPSTVKKILGEE